MKKLILIITILLLFVNSILSQSIRIHNCSVNDSLNYIKIYSLISSDLLLDTANIEIIISPAIFNENLSGVACVNFDKKSNVFIINVDKILIKKFKIKIFIHEIVHISQINQRKLILLSHTVWYEGITYTSNDIYDNRKYEIDANKISSFLYSKYKTNFKYMLLK